MPGPGFRPRVSVIVPARNCAATIEPCIEALLAQDYPRELVEIIIVENRSTDATPALVARYPVTLLSEGEIETSYAARNRGVAETRGDVVAFTDGDCIPRADWLRHLIAPLEDRHVGASVGSVADAEPETLWEEFTARANPFARPTRNGLATLLTVNVAVRRSTFDDLGGFDEHLPTGGDVDFGWRMQQRSLALAEAPEAIVAHRHRSTLRGVFAQYRRYGLSEIVLATIHPQCGAPLSQQCTRMLAQLRAIGTYLAGAMVRNALRAAGRVDRRHALWPLFLLTVEVGNLTGKVEGLLRTRARRRNPFPNPRLDRSEESSWSSSRM